MPAGLLGANSSGVLGAQSLGLDGTHSLALLVLVSGSARKDPVPRSLHTPSPASLELHGLPQVKFGITNARSVLLREDEGCILHLV